MCNLISFIFLLDRHSFLNITGIEEQRYIFSLIFFIFNGLNNFMTSSFLYNKSLSKLAI